MKPASKELKRQARENLTGHYGTTMAAFIITELIIMVLNFPFNLAYQFNPSNFQMIVTYLATLIVSLLSVVLSSGLAYIHLNIARGKQTQLSDLFYFFSRRPDRFILAGLRLMGILLLAMVPALFLTVVAVILDSILTYLLLIVVWIVSIVIMCILSFSYGLVYYLLIDHPEYRLHEAFSESRRLMKGNKGRMFYIGLSFIGLALLSIISFCIGLLWVGPYMTQTNVEFYRNIIGELPLSDNKIETE